MGNRWTQDGADLAVLEAYALTGSDEAFGKAISEVCDELRAARKALVRIAKGEDSGFELQQIAIRFLADKAGKP